MRTAVFIHTFPGANSTVRRHFAYYKKSKCDLFAVNTTGGGCEWPEAIPILEIGENSYINGDKLPRRLVNTFAKFLEEPRFIEYSHAMVVEYDGIFFREPPAILVEAAAHLAGFKAWSMKADKFFHCPWWLSRASATAFVRLGNELIAKGDCEGGSPDIFFGYAFQTLGIPVAHLEGTYSRNTVDSEQSFQEIRSGKPWFVHGIKSERALNAITQ